MRNMQSSRDARNGACGNAMPTISWFYGISIRMFLNDHPPPHFHAYYEIQRGRDRNRHR